MNDLTFDKINKANIIRKGETALMIYVADICDLSRAQPSK